MDRVCLDVQILIWGVQGVASKGQEHMIKPAKAFVNFLNKHQVSVCIPSIVLSEFLCGIDPKRREANLRVLREHYRILPLDARAAHEAAKVFQRWNGTDLHEALKENGELYSRREFKADCKIIGTMMAHGVDLIFSNDTRTLHKLAEGFVRAEMMPAVGEQIDLAFDEAPGVPAPNFSPSDDHTEE